MDTNVILATVLVMQSTAQVSDNHTCNKHTQYMTNLSHVDMQ